MDNSTWTFFCRDGTCDGDYRPVFRRYVCHGAASSIRAADNGEGVGENRLQLWIRDRRTCLVDEAGQFVTLAEAALQPGDRIAPGNRKHPDGKVWRVRAVVPPAGGIGLGRGWTITAE